MVWVKRQRLVHRCCRVVDDSGRRAITPFAVDDSHYDCKAIVLRCRQYFALKWQLCSVLSMLHIMAGKRLTGKAKGGKGGKGVVGGNGVKAKGGKGGKGGKDGNSGVGQRRKAGERRRGD